MRGVISEALASIDQKAQPAAFGRALEAAQAVTAKDTCHQARRFTAGGLLISVHQGPSSVLRIPDRVSVLDPPYALAQSLPPPLSENPAPP
jgi:hypothetical protein